MITSVHLLIYSDDAPATRAFLRDVLAWPHVDDTGSEPGWLIFGTGRSELGVHPTRSTWEGEEHTSPRQHQISLMCDDLEATVEELRGRGATFSAGISDVDDQERASAPVSTTPRLGAGRCAGAT